MSRLIPVVVLLVAPLAAAADWPQFRGPDSAGVSEEKGLPVQFTEKEGVRWKAKLPARGVSCPVVVGDKVFVTCSGGLDDDRLHVLAFDTKTGKELWHRQYTATGLTTAHPKTCMAAPTPAADAQGLYALFATGDLIALDHDGNQLWYRSIVGDYPTVSNQVGMASSPVLVGDKLILPMENSGESFIAAIDTATGKNVWKTARPRGSNWTTPTVRTAADKETEVLFQGPKGLVAYSAETGSEKWTLEPGESIPTLSVIGDDLLVPLGAGIARYSRKDGKWEEQWKVTKIRTGDTSALCYAGRVYSIDPKVGVVFCTDVKTGKAVWDEKIYGAQQGYSASPVAGDGKVYFLSEKGTLSVFKAGGDEAELLGTSEVGGKCIATPAISGGALFIRTDDADNGFLLCVGK